jgi:UDP-N-acetylmuramate--alanine ligase
MEHPDARFLASNSQVTDFLVTNLQGGDVLIVLSAGDANQISQDVVDSLSRNGNANNA